MDVNRVFTTPVFGPLQSRRFGSSLGVDVIPRKLCTLDCIYCEVGRTDKRGFIRKEFVPRVEIIEALEEAIVRHPEIDCVTFSGSGEPTLHSGLGYLVAEAGRLSKRPVVVLTNGTLLWRDDVREDLLGADIVSPSLNAVSEDLFRRINRPHRVIRPDLVLDGLITFRKEFKGKYLLEILFVKGLNDTDEEVEQLRMAVERIQPDKVHINTVVRPPAEPWAKPVSMARLTEIRNLLGDVAEIINPAEAIPVSGTEPVVCASILSLVLRRAMGSAEIAMSLSADTASVRIELERMSAAGVLRTLEHEGETYYTAAEEPHLG